MATFGDLKADIADVVSYDPETGDFTWVGSYHKSRIGQPAGSHDVYGYRRIQIGNISHKAHRLAWLLYHGEWPSTPLDHINGIRDDNRIVNLRPATFAENAQNAPRPRSNTSGFHGVSWNKRQKKWRAHIRVKGEGQIYLGSFDTPQDASAAYLTAKARFHTFQPSPRDIGRPA